MTRTTMSPLEPSASVSAALERWAQEGLVTPEQASRLRADVEAHAAVPLARPPAVPESLLTEALSYLGGVLVLVAGGLLTARFWQDLSFGSRVLLAATATLVLLGAGLLVPARLGGTGRRVRAVLWVLSVVALAATLAVVAVDGWGLEGVSVGMVAAGGSGMLAAALWWRSRTSLQLLAMGAAGALLSATTAVRLLGDRDGVTPGLAVFAVSVLATGAAMRGWLAPLRTALAVGSAGALIGALVTTGGEADWAYALAVAVVVAVVVAAVRLDDLLVLGLGALGALSILPQAVTHFFPGLIAAALVLLAAGAGLIASGIAIAGRRAGPGRPRSP